MSIDNHPNFHAVKFTTNIIHSYYESLRGNANKKNAPNIEKLVVEFVSKIEEEIDSSVEKPYHDSGI